MSDDELENLRRRRISELQQQATGDQNQSQVKKQIDTQKEALLRQILSPEARQRLTNLKMIKPEFTDHIELQLIQLALSLIHI